VHSGWPKNGNSIFESRPDFYEIDESEDGKRVNRVLRVLRQAARDGQILVWGIENPRELRLDVIIGAVLDIEPEKVHDLIPRDHWRSHHVVAERAFQDIASLVWTQPANGMMMFDEESYSHLMVCRRQIELLFTERA
jgi:hypothetical protein